MKIRVVGIPVRDQEKALKFYTEKLGFIKKRDLPLGEGNRWLTVVSGEKQDGPELLLEPAPNHFEPAKVFQNAVKEAGMPYTQFRVDNVQEEYERLSGKGVEFTMEPTEMGTTKIAMFDDTCGNYMMIVEML
ncbi:VOC family protein [Rhodohalobacter mucosus]|uniref:Glyoxalase n=1 Tax=Rhodohalobacter mucosus TaxID=2079485 RepID=A0A316TVI3_9BACT|nr:VOC family protein [Rhodohalobacter mucosus]PWN07329.1 glyoxalase [Rhodohalobacter mucosus]